MLRSRLCFHRSVWFSLSRRFCDKESEKSAGDVKDREKQVERKQEASKKLASLLKTLNVEAQNVDKSNNNITLKLAKPSVKNKKLLKKAKPADELETGKTTENENQVNVEAVGLVEPQLVSAARSVAKDLGGDSHRTESELIQKLRTHAEETKESRDRKQVKPKSTARIAERLFEGMKFDAKTTAGPRLKKKQPRGRPRIPETIKDDDATVNVMDYEPERVVVRPESKLLRKMRAHMAGEDQLPHGEKSDTNLSQLFVGVKIDRTKEPERKVLREQRLTPRREPGTNSIFGDFRKASPQPQTAFGKDGPVKHDDGERVNLFGGTPLNIFKIEKESETTDSVAPILETWDRLQEHELNLLVDHPPENAYEEMIEWTEQGKFWKFPIDNEQGLEEEMKVGFEEHIFLETQLHGFPETGPVRHFMELVTVGLSKNPYITVQRKREHIDWFRQYFKEKEAILKETGAIMA